MTRTETHSEPEAVSQARQHLLSAVANFEQHKQAADTLRTRIGTLQSIVAANAAEIQALDASMVEQALTGGTPDGDAPHRAAGLQATNRANTRAVELLQPQLALAEAKLQQADNSIEGARVGLAREQHREAVLAWFDYLKAGLPLLQAAEQFGAQGAVSMNRGQGMHLDANPSRWFFGSIRTTV